VSDRPMTVREAGRKGGIATRDKNGPDYFKELGKRVPVKPRSYYQAIGRKGGAATARRHAK